jgi:hypothetical protein
MDINLKKDIDQYKPTGLNLVALYWSPTAVSESKKLIFIEVKHIKHLIEETAEEKILPTAVFVDPFTKEVIHQASTRLVSVFEREEPEPGTPFYIEYKGKIKNSTNAYMSDNWAIYKMNA